MQTYTVQMGDTLYGISKQFGVSVEDIKLENDLSNNIVFVGQVLRIPTDNTTSFYVVKKGDTLYSIANKYGVSVSDIMKVNNLNTTVLNVGQQLRIPINSEDVSTNYLIYTVKVGDTLYSIAKKYNVSVDSIKQINNLSSNLLTIGQQLKIISTNNYDEVYDTYVVKSGDTLYKIANRYGMTVRQLMEINNLETTGLSIGQILKVVNSVDGSITLGFSCYGDNYKEPVYITYTVKRGDNLYNIAKSYNTSVDDLIELNDLNSINLYIGQVLKIREVV